MIYYEICNIIINNSELGRGKYGVVHLVEEKETRKYFAQKCIKTRKRVKKKSQNNLSGFRIFFKKVIIYLKFSKRKTEKEPRKRSLS